MITTSIVISAMQFRSEVAFARIQSMLAAKNIAVILLKGPHLGATVYDSPKERLYADLDILVKPGDFEPAAAILLDNGCKPFAFDTHAAEVQRDFKHWEFISPWNVPVELHRWLSGHDRYRLDHAGLFRRAEKFNFGATAAWGLSGEDLLLHLCLHMGTSYFYAIERKHVLDLALLLRKKNIDWPVFLRRTRKAGAKAIAYYALLAARLQNKAAVPDPVLKALRPGFLRRRWLEKYIDPRGFPIYRFPENPIKKVKNQLILPLMDSPGQWAGFFMRMMATKIRMLSRVAKGKLGKRR